MQVVDRAFTLIGSLSLVILASGSTCSNGGNPGFDGGLADAGGRDASVEVVQKFAWGISHGFTGVTLPGAPMAVAAGSGGRIAIAYYSEPEVVEPYHCSTNLGESDIEYLHLKLARYDGSAWSDDYVESVLSADAVAATYDGASLQLVYMSGPSTGTYCGVSQLFGRYISDGSTGSANLLVGDSSTGDACRLMQNTCNAGDNPGRFPDLELLDDGRMLLAYQDTHFNFGQQTDLEGSDLEIMLGGTPVSGGRRCLDDSSGAGYFLDAFTGMGGRPAIAYWTKATHNFNSTGCLDHPPVEDGTSYIWKRGIYLAQEQDDGTWTNTHIADITIDQRLAAAYTEADGYVIAYRLGSTLAAYTSMDGATWRSKSIDATGRNGVSPSAAIDGHGRIVVSYARCSLSPAASCSAAQDGVRLAVLEGGAWSQEEVVNDVDSLDGVETYLRIDPDNGTPLIVYRNATSRQLMIARGTPVE